MVYKIAVVTNMPSYHAIQTFNEIERLGKLTLRVFYLRKMSYGRLWTENDLPKIEHDAVFIPELRLYKHLYLSPGLLKKYFQYNPDLMVMTQYASPGMQAVMWMETARKTPWVFWSEPPHIKYNDAPIIPNETISNFFRSIALFPVAKWPKEVWGIGSRAVEEYQKVVQGKTPVRNVPYYSDLTCFKEMGKCRKPSPFVRFLFCGSLTARKGADLFAQAIKQLSEMGFQFEVVIAGSGPLGKLFLALPEHARKKMRLLGFVSRQDIPTVYSQTDVLVFPSRYDGWGMTLVEGMASGQPAISTKQTGAAIDLIKNQYTGILLEEPTIDNLQQAMVSFLRNPSSIKSLGENSVKVAENYQASLGASYFTELVTKCLA